jgi:hypothetical protein
MYANRLAGVSDVIGDILKTGAAIYQQSQVPMTTDPRYRLPGTPPFVNPATGQFLPAPTLSDYTLPLVIGGGVLLLLVMNSRRRARR